MIVPISLCYPISEMCLIVCTILLHWHRHHFILFHYKLMEIINHLVSLTLYVRWIFFIFRSIYSLFSVQLNKHNFAFIFFYISIWFVYCLPIGQNRLMFLIVHQQLTTTTKKSKWMPSICIRDFPLCKNVTFIMALSLSYNNFSEQFPMASVFLWPNAIYLLSLLYAVGRHHFRAKLQLSLQHDSNYLLDIKCRRFHAVHIRL